ncbi:hypothetical protein ALC57_05538, partial [Trachymyrmex cornetzi]
KNIVTEKANQNEDEQATAEEKKDLPKFDSTTDRDKTNTNVSQTSSIFENSTTHVLAKECPTCGGLSCRPTAEGVDEFRLDVYDIHDIKNKEKNQWWKYAKLRTQFLTSSPRDRKQQMVNQLLDSVADDLMKVPSVTKERKNVLLKNIYERGTIVPHIR